MFLHIDYHSSKPIYQQAVEQIKLMVVNGTLKPGDRLPSVRKLAQELQINPTTTARIYTELAHQAVVVLRQGQGAFVANRNETVAPQEVRRIVGDHARRMLVEGFRLGLTQQEIGQIVAEEMQNIGRGNDE